MELDIIIYNGELFEINKLKNLIKDDQYIKRYKTST